jgi:hypothetical protein
MDVFNYMWKILLIFENLIVLNHKFEFKLICSVHYQSLWYLTTIYYF